MKSSTDLSRTRISCHDHDDNSDVMTTFTVVTMMITENDQSDDNGECADKND